MVSLVSSDVLLNVVCQTLQLTCLHVDHQAADQKAFRQGFVTTLFARFQVVCSLREHQRCDEYLVHKMSHVAVEEADDEQGQENIHADAKIFRIFVSFVVSIEMK